MVLNDRQYSLIIRIAPIFSQAIVFVSLKIRQVSPATIIFFYRLVGKGRSHKKLRADPILLQIYDRNRMLKVY
jgi:hypothetical protein